MKSFTDIFLYGIFEEAQKRLDCSPHNLMWWAWPEPFANTTGPHGGIGGQAITDFQVFKFEDALTGKSILWCDGLWKWPKTPVHRWQRN